METVIPTTPLPVSVPDDEGVTSLELEFDLTDYTGTVSEVTFGIYMTHAYVMAVRMELVHPDSTVVRLCTNPDVSGTDGSGDDFGSPATLCTFVEDAAENINNATPPFIGEFQPRDSLTDFNGKSVAGIWTLRITDDFTPDAGTVHVAQLNITGAVAPPSGPETDGFTVQITPLLAPAGTIAEEDLVEITQYADLNVTHPLNGGRTAQVTLSMHDPVVETLEPYEFALRVTYRRGEVVFWGQAWFSEDYAAGTITIEAQDPSLRLQHHYLRFGDDALGDGETGTLTADSSGIFLAVDAARNTAAQDTRGDPDLGIAEGAATGFTLINPVQIERGQEVWDVIQQLSRHSVGPDFDLWPVQTLPASDYVQFDCYDGDTGGLGRDLTPTDPDAPTLADVVFDYGVGLDNLEDVRHDPGRPTTHAHIVDGRLARATRANTVGSTTTGVFVDWVAVDFIDVIESGESLPKLAEARVTAYGTPPKFLTLELRPDAVQTCHYGHPSVTPNTLYVGDIITVRAERGYRSFSTPARITEVQLTQPGWRAPAVTRLKVVPTIGGTPVDEES